jgi:hypothetical protein
MIDIGLMTTFFGWCSVINLTIYTFSALYIALFRSATVRIHSKFSGVDATKLPILYFQYLANYKIILLVFTVVPYIALTLMA